jgi:hypothetical protein
MPKIASMPLRHLEDDSTKLYKACKFVRLRLVGPQVCELLRLGSKRFEMF